MPKIYKRKCDICGKEYKGQGKNFCSKQCYWKWHKGKNLGGFQKGNKLGQRKHTKDEIQKMSKILKEYYKKYPKGKRGKSSNWKGGISFNPLYNQICRQKFKKKHIPEIKKRIEEIKLKQGCEICGYNKCATALCFHHKPNEKKLFEISKWYTKVTNWLEIQKEIKKCLILCLNCHAEIHQNKKNA